MSTETTTGWRPAGSHRQRLPVPDCRPARKQRAIRARGQRIESRLLTAGRAELAKQGLQALTVDHIVRRAHIAHGTFYLYFANKNELLDALSRDALEAMDRIAGEFPVVTPDGAGRAALRDWVSGFCDTYQAHAAVLGTLSQSPEFGLQAWGSGLDRLLRLAGTMSARMAAGSQGQPGGNSNGNAGGAARADRDARLSAVACLMMLEREIGRAHV